MEKITAKVFRTESFGAVDGPGVRLVIFLQGCNFRCKYCHNPESWTIENPQAKDMTIDDILKIYDRNKFYYEAGGITLSGGEPLMHPEFCLALAKECREKQINLVIDTSASTYSTNSDNYAALLPYVNLWLVDIKATNPMDHKYITGSPDLTGVNFIAMLEEAQKPYWVRCVIVKGLNDSDEQLENLGKILAGLKYMQKYEILPYHDLGAEKYAQLGISYSLQNTLVMSYDEYDIIVQKIKTYIEKYKM